MLGNSRNSKNTTKITMHRKLTARSFFSPSRAATLNTAADANPYRMAAPKVVVSTIQLMHVLPRKGMGRETSSDSRMVFTGICLSFSFA